MDPYVEAVEAQRRAKDAAFRNDPQSPLPRHERPAFQGLRYYPVDPAMRFRVRLERLHPAREVRMQASDGAIRHYRDVGWFELPVAGQAVRIHAYESENGHGLFIPFRDATSGKETYGAGRYLEAHPLAEDEYEVDLNLAYNPFCAYDDAYSCPFPPPDNWLQVPLRAGEKTYKD